MIRQDPFRIDAKRKSTVDHRRKQFTQPEYKELQYDHRLNFYTIPPTVDITLEQFEQWAIDRLRGLQSLSLHAARPFGQFMS
jgi:DNA primase large subunit